MHQLHLRKNDFGTWVFDDPLHGLVEEPLILGMSEIVDNFVGSAREAVIRFTLGDSDFFDVLLREEPHDGGYFYRLKGTDLRGWLCPATLHYFPEGHPDAIAFMAAPYRRASV